MSDRLPQPTALHSQPLTTERASATPAGARVSSDPLPIELAADARPSTLAELQAWMVAAICDPRERTAAGVVSEGPRLSARDRLAIYRHGYTARLSECLRDDYPVLAASLGEASFDALCQEYIARHPSSSPSLNAFGRHMADFCRSTSLLAAGAFYSDLARLEWALVEVTHAPTTVPLGVSDLQRIPADAWGEARLVASEALRLLAFDYPVNAHYQAYRGDGVLLPLAAAGPSATVVYRRDLTLWRMDLTPAMARVLDALVAGSTITQALGGMNLDESDSHAQAEAERSVMIWFQAWMSSGFFTQVLTTTSGMSIAKPPTFA